MCDALFKVKSVCGSSYGPPLKIYTNNQSKAKCAVACSQDTSCYSSVYDDITHVCQIFPDYHVVGGCATAEYYSAVFQVNQDCFIVTKTNNKRTSSVKAKLIFLYKHIK